MTMSFRTRKRGTPRQIGKKFPVLEKKKLPKLHFGHTKTIIRTLKLLSRMNSGQLEKWCDKHPEKANLLEMNGYLQFWQEHGHNFVDTTDRLEDTVSGKTRVGDGGYSMSGNRISGGKTNKAVATPYKNPRLKVVWIEAAWDFPQVKYLKSLGYSVVKASPVVCGHNGQHGKYITIETDDSERKIERKIRNSAPEHWESFLGDRNIKQQYQITYTVIVNPKTPSPRGFDFIIPTSKGYKTKVK